MRLGLPTRTFPCVTLPDMRFGRVSTLLLLAVTLLASKGLAQSRPTTDSVDDSLEAAEGQALLAPGSGWRGQGRTGGIVLDKASQPLAGAKVSLRRSEASSEGPSPTQTDRKGRWSIGGLAGGPWQIRIEAEGYIAASGVVQVSPQGPSPSVEVELRPLTEVPPAGLEGGMLTVIGWLDRANSLLDQKRYAEARELYLKARPPLPPDKQAEVSRSIARTQFLEGDRAGAIRTLQLALIEAPTDTVSRQLLGSLPQDPAEAERMRAWIERLDAGESAVLAKELEVPGAEPVPRRAHREGPPELPLEEAMPDRTGFYRTFFTEASPWGGVERLAPKYELDLPRIEAVDPEKGRYEITQESFTIYVPASYRRGEPIGLFVWISPGPYGGPTSEGMPGLMDAHRLIWVGANQSGNQRSKWVRLSLALDAVHNLQRLYDIDPQRVYVSGYSGGGRTASALGMLFSNVFRGFVSVMGIDYFRPIPAADRPGTHWNPGYPPPPRAEMRRIKESSRLVLLTGERDYNRLQTKVYARELRKDGFENVSFIEVPGMSHYDPQPLEWFRKALDAVDPAGAATP